MKAADGSSLVVYRVDNVACQACTFCLALPT